jgi:hypothetical protein
MIIIQQNQETLQQIKKKDHIVDLFRSHLLLRPSDPGSLKLVPSMVLLDIMDINQEDFYKLKDPVRSNGQIDFIGFTHLVHRVLSNN